MNKLVLNEGVLRPKTKHNKLGRNVGRQTRAKRGKPLSGLNLDSIKTLIDIKQPRICVIRSLGGIGDVLMTTPALRAIKHNFPNCYLTYATDLKYMDGALRDVLLYNPYIDEIITYQAALSREYDFVCDVTSVCIATERHTENKSLIPNRIDIFADYVGISLSETGYTPVYIVSDQEKAWAKEKLLRYPLKNQDSVTIGIQARASTLARSWPLEKVKELAIRLSTELKARVCIFDSSHGQGPKEDWNISGLVPFKDYNIRQVAALINEMDLMLTPDSGLMHIAGALNKKLVTLWAGTDSNARINHYPNAIAIANQQFACKNCWYNPSACRGQYTCIRTLDVDTVLEGIKQKLQDPYIEVTSAFDMQTCDMYIRRDTGGYGDIVNITCAVDWLKKQNPSRTINVAVPKQYWCIFDNNPSIGKCIEPQDLNKKDLGIVKNLSLTDTIGETAEYKKNKKVLRCRRQLYLEAVGCLPDQITSEIMKQKLYLTPGEITWANSVLNEVDKFYVYLPLFAAEEYRCWPYKYYLELAELVKQYNDIKLVFGAEYRSADALPSNVIDATGFDFRRAMALVHQSNLIITPDTSIVHVANAFEKPCLAIFGPIDGKVRCKFHTKTNIIQSKRSCVPCWRNGHIGCKETYSQKSQCMLDVKPKDVFQHLILLRDKIKEGNNI